MLDAGRWSVAGEGERWLTKVGTLEGAAPSAPEKSSLLAGSEPPSHRVLRRPSWSGTLHRWPARANGLVRDAFPRSVFDVQCSTFAGSEPASRKALRRALAEAKMSNVEC